MSKLPVVSGRDVAKAFGKLGYALDRQSACHLILRNATSPHRRLTVPDHRTIAKGTLRALIREAGLTVEEFIALL